ncbi:MAG: CoA transferase, partial [Deltaproteobacteria bacterium]
GPFYHDAPDQEKSLYWLAFNNNKRGITLNIETNEGQLLFKKLAQHADFVIESFPPGYMDRHGLNYSMLSEINPRIIVTSITPFGQSGPYKDYKVADIVAWGMAGPMYVCGDPDRPPLQIGFPQAYINAGVSAAVGSLVAHYWRGSTGEGQQVDVSIQESAVWSQLAAHHYWSYQGEIQRRVGTFRIGRDTKGVAQRITWPCKDGFVALSMLGGPAGAKSNRAMVEWIESEGMANEFLKNLDWNSVDGARTTQELQNCIEEVFGRFILAHTKAELLEGAVMRGVWLYPVYTVKGLVESQQLAARGHWVEIEHQELGADIKYPGAFVVASETPCTIRHRAPLIGEHNDEIYEGELGLTNKEVIALKQSGVI